MALKPQMQAQLTETLDKLQDLVDDTADEAQQLGRTARREIRSHPNASVAIALGAGFLAGILMASACRK
jgi:ElaB/YqjD/DUF883 family membrane-anchored ribosome-binding protein